MRVRLSLASNLMILFSSTDFGDWEAMIVDRWLYEVRRVDFGRNGFSNRVLDQTDLILWLKGRDCTGQRVKVKIFII